jgi:hypothetical protein
MLCLQRSLLRVTREPAAPIRRDAGLAKACTKGRRGQREAAGAFAANVRQIEAAGTNGQMTGVSTARGGARHNRTVRNLLA